MEDEREEVIRTGEESARLLGTEAFTEAVEAVRAAIVKRWRASTEVADRERAHAMDAALDAVLHALTVQMQNGQYEAGLLERENAKDADSGTTTIGGFHEQDRR